MQKKAVLLLSIFVLILAAGCATLKPWGERTPQERSLAFLQLYNSQYADTMRLANTPGLTEGQKEVVRVKKKLLVEVRPLISLYDSYVTGGGTIPPDLEGKIIGLLDLLAAKGG